MIIITPSSKNTYMVVNSFTFCDVTVPHGYTTNGASIPRWLWSLYPPFQPRYMPAIILHDYLCDIADGTIPSKDAKHTITEGMNYADDKLEEALTKLGASNITVLLWSFFCRLYHKLKYKGI